eukprot:SAG31_NODE_393_length_16293_cov_15.804372_14_plen_110_part_00
MTMLKAKKIFRDVVGLTPSDSTMKTDDDAAVKELFKRELSRRPSVRCPSSREVDVGAVSVLFPSEYTCPCVRQTVVATCNISHFTACLQEDEPQMVFNDFLLATCALCM